MPSKPQPPERLVPLDALRGVLALAVAAYHFFVVVHPFTGLARDVLVIAGIYAVPTFFLLSGFCFFHLYGARNASPPTWRAFYLKRFFRIAPLYYLTIGISPWLDPPVYAHPPAHVLLENLTLSFGFVHPNHALVPGGWSIGIECVFYALLPALLWLTRPRDARWVLTLLLLSWAVAIEALGVNDVALDQRFHAYVSLGNHAFLFLLGGLIVDLRARVHVRLSPWWLCLPALAWLVAIALAPAFSDHWDVMHGVARARYLTLACLTVVVVALQRPIVGPLCRALGHLGDWSYAAYLLHPFVWRAMQALGTSGLPAAWQLVLGLLATLVTSFVAHRLFERPLYQWSRRVAEGLARRTRWQPKVQSERAWGGQAL